MSLSKNEIIKELRRVYSYYQRPFSRNEFRERGEISTSAVERAFGNWSSAVSAALSPEKKQTSFPKAALRRNSLADSRKLENAKPFKSVLCISDPHKPYDHPDNDDFLFAIYKKYKCDKVVCLGDEVDKQALKYHERDPDLPSAGNELDQAIQSFQKLYEAFPKMDILVSNHGTLAKRQAKTAGIPQRYLRDFGEVLEAPDGWVWHEDLILTLSDGSKVYFTHGKSLDVVSIAVNYGMHVVQGHFHTSCKLEYVQRPAGQALLWGMNIACSIDNSSPAFEYNKKGKAVRLPIMSHAVILEGKPSLIPMPLDSRNRWTGKVP